jgi:hypothetical protein
MAKAKMPNNVKLTMIAGSQKGTKLTSSPYPDITDEEVTGSHRSLN